ncbi:MAG: aspartyl protease family protein [Alphaproteobacteria bacterium]
MNRRFLIVAAAAGFAPRIAWGDEAPPVAPLDLSQGQPRVALSINHVEQGVAIFDTGASASVINRQLAETLSLPNKGSVGARSGAGGDTIEGFLTSISGAAIGAIPIPTEAQWAALPQARPNIVAVVSANAFAGSFVRLDFPRAHLQVLPKTSANTPAAPPTAYDSGPRPLPSIQLSLPGGVSMLAHLDTGSPAGITLPYEMATSLPLAAPAVEAGRARLVNGERTIYRGTLNGSAQVGPLALSNPTLMFMEGLPHGNVGMELLRQLVVTLDPAERRLWISLP